jgi:hypothetical protein
MAIRGNGNRMEKWKFQLKKGVLSIFSEFLKKQALKFQCNSRDSKYKPIDKIFCIIFDRTSEPFSKNQKTDGKL